MRRTTLPPTDPELRAALQRTKELLRALPHGDLRQAILERKARIERTLPPTPNPQANYRR